VGRERAEERGEASGWLAVGLLPDNKSTASPEPWGPHRGRDGCRRCSRSSTDPRFLFSEGGCPIDPLGYLREGVKGRGGRGGGGPYSQQSEYLPGHTSGMGRECHPSALRDRRGGRYSPGRRDLEMPGGGGRGGLERASESHERDSPL
jgi:hypothetical protein